MNESWLDVDGIATRYFIVGHGAPVVLVHGGQPGSRYLAWGAEIWSDTFAALANAFEVIAFDRPGQGASAAPPADDAYTLDHDAQHAAAFLTALGKAVAIAQMPSYQSAVSKVVDAGVEQRILAPALGRGRIAIYRHLVHDGLAVPTFVNSPVRKCASSTTPVISCSSSNP